ncbi:ABC transporter substrate-binding protein [Pseudomonas sp. SZMC_28357]|uniref:ABC transporter substrate-binding protein n=1 Tax=Pseudomonas sp. SZMC_28357 TaxID=3074380 RepID=UPI0028719C1D|nr:ABC transporter substrate-binding protein [Pseudomonas sp. SZMC_28357]MDR9751546.1 ABC transporter substrate-binding protein [Pseudomonas sp. SZMC_28357]
MKLQTEKKITAALWATACLSSPAAMADPQKLTVALYGGNWGEAFIKCVAEPFTKATGIAVASEVGTSTVTLAKLQQQKSSPTIDVAWMDGGISEMAHAAGVVADLDAAAIPNLKNVQDKALYSDAGHTFAVSSGFYSLGLTYNTKEIPEAPTSWKDLWKPEYAGAIALPSPANSSGVPFVFFMADVWGIDRSNLDAVYSKLGALDTALFFDSSGAATNAFQSGEAIIGAHFNVGAWDLIDKGAPIGFTIPKEGAWATDARLHLIKGAKNPKAGEQFINTALTKEAASCLAGKLYLGPAVKDVEVAEDVARKLPWGVGGSIDSLRLFDWAQINAQRSKVTDDWNRKVTAKN